MKFYIVTEIFEIEDGAAFTTTNNHSHDKNEAFNMFLTRREMLLNTKDVRVIRDNFSKEEEWGFTKVMLDNGNTIEIAINSLQLV